MYVCLYSLIKGFKHGCRPIIGLDGCFLKGFAKGELLSAIGRDGNNQMFPIAWALVEVENKDNWSWFLDLLATNLECGNGYGFTFISDQQKGLLPAISEIMPQSEHRHCARHIYSNWRKKHKGEAYRTIFWKAAKAYNIADFDKHMNELNSLDNDAHKNLLKTPPKHWCRAFFSETAKCDYVDNNLCETFNGYIIEARSKPVISMLEEIRTALMVRLQEKRDFMGKKGNMICPRPLAKLEKNKDLSRFCETLWNGDSGYQVKIGSLDKYTVDLKKGTCSCNEWNITGIPCCHAISAIYYNKEEPESYISHWFTKETYMKAYELMLEPINGERLWPKSNLEEIVAPLSRRMPGRPKKLRRRESFEPKNSTRISRKGMKLTCRICSEKGHNYRSCPLKDNPPAKDSEFHAKKKVKAMAETSTTGGGQTYRAKACHEGNASTKRQRQSIEGFGVYTSPKTGETYINVSNITKGSRPMITPTVHEKDIIKSSGKNDFNKQNPTIGKGKRLRPANFQWNGNSCISSNSLQEQRDELVRKKMSGTSTSDA